MNSWICAGLIIRSLSTSIEPTPAGPPAKPQLFTLVHYAGVLTIGEGLYLYMDYWKGHIESTLQLSEGLSEFNIVTEVDQKGSYDYCIDDRYFRKVSQESYLQPHMIPSLESIEDRRPDTLRCRSDGGLLISLPVRHFKNGTSDVKRLILFYDREFTRRPMILLQDASSDYRSMLTTFKELCTCYHRGFFECFELPLLPN